MKTKEILAYIQDLKDNFPSAWEQVQHKANWEHITLAEVITSHKDYIETLK